MKHYLIYSLLLVVFFSCKKDDLISEAEKSASKFGGNSKLVGEYKGGTLSWQFMNNGALEERTDPHATFLVKYVGKDKVSVNLMTDKDISIKKFDLVLHQKQEFEGAHHSLYIYTTEPYKEQDGGKLEIKVTKERSEGTFYFINKAPSYYVMGISGWKTF